MKLKNDRILCLSILSFLFGAILFMFGFFPLSHSSDERASSIDLPEFINAAPLNKSIYTPQVSRIVLMVIDALRRDFVQPSSTMRNTNSLINDGNAYKLNLHVESPTVTMPRLKAMTTGTIPNFIDVILNLGSSELNIDSFLHQIVADVGEIVFAGDSTWTKMFPDLFERTYANEDSLFVNDFVEGDRNITSVLVDELKQYDYRLLVLHFLGLDHIGHVEGPFSEKIPLKLAEMDGIVSTIHSQMQKWNKYFAEPTLLLVTGDHGMRDTGGHGGSSYAETNVPLIVIGKKYAGADMLESYQQIDIAATVSVLYGLPIPASSIGVLISELLTDLSMEHQLYAYYYNGNRLKHKLILAEGHTGVDEQFDEAKRQHEWFLRTADVRAFKRAKSLYVTSSKAMSEQLAKAYINYDDFSISVGFAVIFISILNILLSHASSRTNSISVPLHWLAAIAITGGLGGHLIHLQSFSIAAMCALIAFVVIIFLQLIHIPIIEQLIVAAIDCPRLCKFLIFGVIFHTISYASSSFIEEEHQTWYYLMSTILIIVYLLETRADLQSSKSFPIYRQLQWLCPFAAHLIARRLNQTGDKWLTQADIGDWLTMDENIVWNSLFTSVSLCILIGQCVDFGGILTNVLTLTSSTLIYYFRTLGGFVCIAGIKKSDSTSTCLMLFALNLLEIFAINLVPVLYRSINNRLQKFDVKSLLGTSIILFAMVSALTQKPHNIFLVAVQILTSRIVSGSLRRLLNDGNANVFAQCVIHYWMGKQFYFYQGNSNSLASIDLNAGYIGLQSFNFVYVGILLTANTFSGPILSILLLAHHLHPCDEDAEKKRQLKIYRRESNELRDALGIVAILFGFPFGVYTVCALAFRNHIFVWTVFSPKLLYEFFHLCLMVILWFALLFVPQTE